MSLTENNYLAISKFSTAHDEKTILFDEKKNRVRYHDTILPINIPHYWKCTEMQSDYTWLLIFKTKSRISDSWEFWWRSVCINQSPKWVRNFLVIRHTWESVKKKIFRHGLGPTGFFNKNRMAFGLVQENCSLNQPTHNYNSRAHYFKYSELLTIN